MEKTLNLSFIGSGNLAYQLIHAFHKTGLTNIEIFARDKSKSAALFSDLKLKWVDNISAITGDIIFICTNDSAIEEVANLLPPGGVFVHCSGSTPLSILPTENRGVFYPIQTLTKSVLLDFTTIPLCLTADNKEVENLLITLAKMISNVVKVVNDDERLHLHCAAVMTNNFYNHLAKKTYHFLEEKGVDYSLLIPLLARTHQKIIEAPLDFYQTGPAKRNDQTTMEKHLVILAEDPDLSAIYKTISKSIYTYENSKRN